MLFEETEEGVALSQLQDAFEQVDAGR